jgi:DNA-binding MarR family transcriptional regulator
MDPSVQPSTTGLPEATARTADAASRGGEVASRADEAARLAELLTSASRRLRRGVAAQLAPIGLTFAQARAMRLIAAPGCCLRMADIACRLDVVRRSATSIVDSLEAAGLVTRRPDPHDRRSVLVALSDEGRRLLHGLDAARRATAEELLSPLGAEDRAELLRLLTALVAGEGTATRGEDRP